MKKLVCLFGLLSLSVAVAAQPMQDTLQEVSIRAKKKERVLSNDARLKYFAPGQKVISFDSITKTQYQFQNIATLLSQQTPVFVRSYGLNNLATLSFRGASSAQSQVLWNGVPIQNAAVGVADVSLLPVTVMDNISVVYGGSSGMWGSGNVGGALLLENNTLPFDSNGFWSSKVGVAAGSFNQYHIGLNTSLSTKKVALSLNAFGQTAKNDFGYSTQTGAERRMTNAELYGGVVMARLAYKSGKYSSIGLNAWYQQYYREIPPALFEASSVKNQRDESLRLLLDWQREKNRSKWYVKTAFIKDYLQYRDEQVQVNSRYNTYQLYGEAGWNKQLGNRYRVLLFTPVQLAWLDAANATTNHKQLRTALAGALSAAYFNDKLNIALSGRGEVVEDYSFFLPGINASYSPLRWLTLKGNLQRSYRVPTLNELYYNPGGNANLKPEHGWSSDAGYNLRFPIGGNFSVSHGAVAFNRVMEDWILWFGGSIWTPHNISMVHSRGIETDNTLAWRYRRWHVQAGLHTSYVLSTTIVSNIPNDGSAGKQLPYTPRYTWSGFGRVLYQNFSLNYTHIYTGGRYVTIDESGRPLEAYHISNIHLSYLFDNEYLPVQIVAQCNNIFNNRYNVVAFRPMPGINWLMGLKAYIY